LITSVGRVEFVRQLYNLLHTLGEDGGEDDHDMIANIEELNDKTHDHKKRFRLKSFKTRKGQPSKGKGVGTGADDDGSPGAGSGGASAEDSEDLKAHGYEVKSDVIVDGKGGTFEPLIKVRRPFCTYYTLLTLALQMPSNILVVYRRSDPGKQFIAKKVRVKSNELEILKLLNNFQPKSKHIISLLDSFQVRSRAWAILPKMDCLSDYIGIAPHRLSEHIGQICWGLIKGVAYLHDRCIAHRDIKPDNLLLREDFCIHIIDFDVAIQVRDEDEEVNGQCGTEGWMAPEVEGKSSMYSPIRADRWSCGQVMLYLLDEFKKEDKTLRSIATKLKVRRPKQRPSLLEWDSSSALP
jgi:serine/threonine protein kinase